MVSIIALVLAFRFGVINQNTLNRDNQREGDIAQVIKALDEFYKNSHPIATKRTYPPSQCSEYPNEVDFENNLRLTLIGKNLQLDDHTYISPQSFPQDEYGIYSTSLQERKVPYRCENLLTSQEKDKPIYLDSYPSCNLNQQSNLFKCYIYTTTYNADSYTIGYYKESIKKYILYKKFKDNPIKAEIS